MTPDGDAAAPPTPDAARLAFPPDRLPLAERYVQRLATDAVERGLIGPRETPRLWERHVLNCAAVASLVPHGASVADLGSGAGLPGVVLAIARPDLDVTLVEPLLRRTVFLDDVVGELALSCRVVRGRAEELHRRKSFDVVTARALAPLPRLLSWAVPLLRPAGVLLAMKGSSAPEEVEAAAATLRKLRCQPPEVLTVRVGDGASTATVVRVARLATRD